VAENICFVPMGVRAARSIIAVRKMMAFGLNLAVGVRVYISIHLRGCALWGPSMGPVSSRRWWWWCGENAMEEERGSIKKCSGSGARVAH
jgi:hypothetical protein